jgi:chemotaxis regulatin CheY-phosphate phosphatase CheZ
MVMVANSTAAKNLQGEMGRPILVMVGAATRDVVQSLRTLELHEGAKDAARQVSTTDSKPGIAAVSLQ